MTARIHTVLRLLTMALAVTCASASLEAQGIETRTGATVLFGSTANCTQPATIDFDEVKKETPEWKQIRSEGVEPGSGRYQLLMSKLVQRVRRACAKVARDEGRDCVVREGDITNDNGLTVVDLTDDVSDEVD